MCPYYGFRWGSPTPAVKNGEEPGGVQALRRSRLGAEAEQRHHRNCLNLNLPLKVQALKASVDFGMRTSIRKEYYR